MYIEDEEEEYPYDELPRMISPPPQQQPENEIQTASLRSSIGWLGAHVSKSIFNTVAKQCQHQITNDNTNEEEDVTTANGNSNTSAKPPYSTYHQAALLFVDISGFTKLANKLDTETLSQTINGYFHRLLNHCAVWGGDVLKFAGDAIFIQWKVQEEDSNNNNNNNNGGQDHGVNRTTTITTLEDATTYAALCGASIVNDCSNYAVSTKISTSTTTKMNGNHDDDETEEEIILSVHCGLGVGLLAEVHVGGDNTSPTTTRRSSNDGMSIDDTVRRSNLAKEQPQQHMHSRQRKELVIIGDPITQVSTAESIATHGQLVASPQVMEQLSKVCDLFLVASSIDTPTINNNDYHIIADGTQQFFKPRDEQQFTIGSIDTAFRYTTSSENIMNLLEDENENNNNGVQSSATANRINDNTTNGRVSHTLQQQQQQYIYTTLTQFELECMRDMLSLYVHRVVRSSEWEAQKEQQDSSGASMKTSLCEQDVVRARHVSEAEIRSVYTIFIMPQVEAVLTSNPNQDEQLFVLLNDIMNVTSKLLLKFQGDLRQFIVDDKGVVLIATFGLRGSTFPNMVAERGLPATVAIHDALKVMLNVENRIGATIGQVYCGVVGGIYRHEFAVLGPSVNLAARLMCSPTNPGILVDQAVRLQASKRFAFRSYQPVKAKGYSDLVPIFEPASSLDRQWKKTTNNFVGRTAEIQQIRRVAKSILLSDSDQSPCKMILLHAESGLGKSSVVYQSLHIIRQMTQMMHKRAQIAKSVANDENEQLVPFSGFRSVFLSVLTAYEPPVDNSYDPLGNENESANSVSGSSKGSSFFLGMDDVSVDTASLGSTTAALVEKFAQLCNSMDRSPDWAETVGSTLLGLETIHEASTMKIKSDQIVQFLADAFVRCTSRSHITVLALDDVQWIDSMTWKVLEVLYKQAKNLLIIAISRPLSDYTLKVDDEFWNNLKSERMNLSPRYIEMKLSPLEKSDLRQLVANEWGVQPQKVDEQVCDDLFNQTGGMPYFASEICFELKRQGELSQDASGNLCWKKDGRRGQWSHTRHAGEFLLFRFDKLGSILRGILRNAALLGLEFTLAEIAMVELNSESSQSSLDDEQSLRMALQGAIEDQILIEVLSGVDVNDDHLDSEYEIEDEISYRFRHSLWRTCILDTMLNERKREMHRYIASAYETKYCFASGRDDTRFMLKAFGHWKGSDEPGKATELALLICKNFGIFGLNNQSLDLYNDALNMWKKTGNRNEKKKIPQRVLDDLCSADLGLLIQVYTAIGKCHCNLLQAELGNESFEDALWILENTPSACDLNDRSIVFPIYSGMFVLIRGGKIKKEDMRSYEQHLVQCFVDQAELHGDPIHLCRALAMQADTLNRCGEVDKALDVQLRLTKLYNFDDHSAGICIAYGSDRAAQIFSSSALWLEQSGHTARAIQVCEFVLHDLMPKMDPKNVHNAFVMIYPLLWVMKGQGMSLRARDIMKKFVIDAFDEHYGEGATTAMMGAWKPVLVLLELSGGEVVEDLDSLVEWALHEEGLNDFLNGATGGIGRDIESVLAEICLLLSKLVSNNVPVQSQLVGCGLEHSQKSEKVSKPADEKTGYPNCYNMLKPVLKELQDLDEG